MKVRRNEDWVVEGLGQLRDEIRLFLVTARDFALVPRRFAEEWASGRRRALNPLGFLATAFAVVGPAQALALHFLHSDEESGALLKNALGAVLPFVYYLALGALQHMVLRILGSRRRLTDSCAMALYAGGGPGSVATLISLTGGCLWFRLTGSSFINLAEAWQWPVAVILVAMFAYVFVTLAVALATLHQVRAWQAVAAGAFALIVTGMVFAALRPPGTYGLHLVLGPHYAQGHWKWQLNIVTSL